MKKRLVYWGVVISLLFLAWPGLAWAADQPVGVAYRGHIQDLGDYPRDSNWIDSPEMIGTTGQSKRIEGFEIKLTGAVPAGMELRYNVHVQNKGWLYDENDATDWPKDGAYAGTRAESLRIEAVKLVLTDHDGQPLSGYSVQYRGHVQDLGDLPKAPDQWLADGAQLGTVGSSLRLEALLVKVVKTTVDPPEPVVYDSAGSYGPTTGTETIAGDVTVAADGVVLNNLVISGNLTISEAVADGTVTLNNVSVVGDTYVRGGGVHSIKINGGQYSRIVMEKTASGAVRIVATGVDGLDVVVSEDASGEAIILEGAFDSVTVNAPNMTVTTEGNITTIGTLAVGADGGGSTLNLATGTTVADLLLDGKAAVKGQGTVERAAVKADGVVIEKKPGAYTVEPDVVIPPVFPDPNPGGGGAGGPTTIAVTAVSLNKNSASLNIGASETLIATVAPANATNKAVSFSSSAPAVATVDAGTGLVTAVAVGPARITVTTADGSKLASCDVTVDPIAVTSVSLTPATLDLVYEDTATLTATVAPANATNPEITWASSDPLVATVDQNGKVTAVKAGTATITASLQADSAKKATTAVTVHGRLTCYGFRAVAGIDDNNYVALSLAGDTFKDGSSFDFNAGATGLALGSPGWDSTHYTLGFSNTPAPGILTLQATGLYSGINSTTVSVTVLDPVMTFANTAFDDTTASFSWLDLGGASAVTLQQKSGDATWTTAICEITPASTATTVTGLLPGTVYQFRLIVTGGTTPGVSNSVTVTPLFEATGTAEGVTITKYNGGTEPLVIPAEINNQPVIAIAAGAFARTAGQVFSGAVGPSSVEIPASVKSIGNQAFLNCVGMTSLTFAGSSELTVIGDGAFQGCKKLESVTIPSTVTSIGDNAFQQCLAMTSLDLGNVALIGYNAFNQCIALTNLTIPNTVTRIVNQAFSNCSSLKTVDFIGGDNPQTLIGFTFSGCTALETVTFAVNSKITVTGWGIFSGCSKLSSVTLPPNLTAIGRYAFLNCTALESVTIPASVNMIDEKAFNGDVGKLPGSRTITFLGDAPATVSGDAIPAGTMIRHTTTSTGFTDDKFPSCTFEIYGP